MPQFPQLRTIYLLSSPLDLEIGAFTYGLFVGQLDSSWRAWDFQASRELVEESEIEITKTSLKEKNFGEDGGSKKSGKKKALLEGPSKPFPPLINFPMSFIAWNSRGISRPSFEANLMHLVKHHNPDLLFLCETCTSLNHTMRILEKLPFEQHCFMEPWASLEACCCFGIQPRCLSHPLEWISMQFMAQFR